MPKDNFGKKKRKRKQLNRQNVPGTASRLDRKKDVKYNAEDKAIHRKYVLEKKLTKFQENLLNEDHIENLWVDSFGDDKLIKCLRKVSKPFYLFICFKMIKIHNNFHIMVFIETLKVRGQGALFCLFSKDATGI